MSRARMRFTRKFFDPLAAGGEAIDAFDDVDTSDDYDDDGEDGRMLFRAGPRPEDVYVYTPHVLLALNVALATGRPLLISGEPGSGKTTLAANAAAVLGWWSYKQMVTSRIQAADLLWTFDALDRLNDANMPDQSLREKHYYVHPGRLWWAFSPRSAPHRGLTEIPEEKLRASDPGTPAAESDHRPVHDKAVILFDEIDKADPDVPNDLLEPLDIRQFTVRETNDTIVAERQVLLMMTTNGERELPPAFMRRCVSLTLDPPDATWFADVARHKYPEGDWKLHRAVAAEVMLHRDAARKRGVREPSTGEFLDALEVCGELGIDTSSKVWDDVAMSVLWKHERPPDLERDASGAGVAGEDEAPE